VLSPGVWRNGKLGIHMYDYCVYQDLSASARNTFPKATWKGRVGLAVTFVKDYSYFNATMGSTFMARRAGM
jgi:hypothetical protein